MSTRDQTGYNSPMTISKLDIIYFGIDIIKLPSPHRTHLHFLSAQSCPLEIIPILSTLFDYFKFVNLKFFYYFLS